MRAWKVHRTVSGHLVTSLTTITIIMAMVIPLQQEEKGKILPHLIRLEKSLVVALHYEVIKWLTAELWRIAAVIIMAKDAFVSSSNIFKMNFLVQLLLLLSALKLFFSETMKCIILTGKYKLIYLFLKKYSITGTIY